MGDAIPLSRLKGVRGSEAVDVVVNDNPVDCQSHGVTEPKRDGSELPRVLLLLQSKVGSSGRTEKRIPQSAYRLPAPFRQGGLLVRKWVVVFVGAIHESPVMRNA